MFKIFLNIKIKLWKLWIKFKYGKHFLNEYLKLIENTKQLEKLNKTIPNIKDKKFYV